MEQNTALPALTGSLTKFFDFIIVLVADSNKNNPLDSYEPDVPQKIIIFT